MFKQSAEYFTRMIWIVFLFFVDLAVSILPAQHGNENDVSLENLREIPTEKSN